MQLVAGVAGAAVGFAIGGPAGAQVGFTLGSAAYGLFGPKPKGPGPGDLRRPQTTLGAQIPRVYGRVRRTLQVVWASDFRAREVEAGKGTPGAPAGYTYSLDVLGWLADGNNVIGVSRIWVNNKLEWTSLAESTEGSITASNETTSWDDFQFLPGTDSQVPWSVYEDAVGATDAPAYRGVASIGFENFQCGSSKQLPLIEVEIFTAGTLGDSVIYDYTGVVQTYVVGAGVTSIRARAWGAGGGGSTGFGVILFDASGGGGGYANGDVSVTPGETLDVVVGGGGGAGGSATYGGGGDCGKSGDFGGNFRAGGAGGGRSAIVRDFSDIFTAGGGGGAGSQLGEGAPGGGTVGGSATAVGDGGGQGGTQSAGGAGGVWSGGGGSTTGSNGSAQTGGNGGDFNVGVGVDVDHGGGGGGGGYYGGGGGAAGDIIGAGGGGGSSFATSTESGSATIPGGSTESGYAEGLGVGGFAEGSGGNGRLIITVGASPAPVYLDEIVAAEMARVPGIESTDYDVTDLEGIEVTGFTAIGSAAQSIGDLADIYHFDLVPGAPMRFVRRAAATVGTIAFNNTGAGVDEAKEPFSGLLLSNNDEAPGVVGLSYPNIAQDHDPDYQAGDRLTTEGPDVRRVDTNVVMTPAEARGRAFSATVMQRSLGKTAKFGISDLYAAAEPGDAYLASDIDDNSVNLRIKRFTYSDGVKDCEWDLNDISAIVDELDTEDDYQEGITVTPAGDAEWLVGDLPLLRSADDGAGYYAAVKTTGTESAFFFESPDDASYANLFHYTTDSVFGVVTAVSGTLRTDGFFTDTVSITVDVGEGSLSSSTRAAILNSRSLNAFAVGVQGRYVLGQFITATETSPGVYVLTGLLMGQKGTEQYAGDVSVSDEFVLLSVPLLRRRVQSLPDLGVEVFVKAVAQRRAIASVTGEAFTNQGESQVPRSPVQLRIDRDASTGDALIRWERRTRWDTRFGGPLGDACPIGEESERYRVRIYDDGTYTTLVRDLGTVTSPQVAYSGADQTTDFGSAQSTLYVDIRQISAAVGEGHPLQAAA